MQEETSEVTIILPNGLSRVRVSLPNNIPIHRLIGPLAKALGLEPIDQSGKLIRYRLFKIDSGIEEELDSNIPLSEAQINSDLPLRLYSELGSEEADETAIPPYLYQFAEWVVDNIEARLKPEMVKMLELHEIQSIQQEQPRHVLAKPVFGLPSELPNFTCDVFVLMPFAKEFYVVYSDVIKPVSEELGLTVKRGDDFFSHHTIVEEIWSAIARCAVIIADCTGRNANVFYELGIAHTLGKPTILITQNVEDVPFDIQGRRFIEYQDKLASMNELKRKLKEYLQLAVKSKE